MATGATQNHASWMFARKRRRMYEFGLDVSVACARIDGHPLVFFNRRLGGQEDEEVGMHRTFGRVMASRLEAGQPGEAGLVRWRKPTDQSDMS
jgi:hypothetical protein